MSAHEAPVSAPGLRLSVWRIVTWVLLLLAIFGMLQYCVHGWHVAMGLRSASGDRAHAALAGMLAWDVAYLAGACITVAAAAGALLRRGWARPALRVVAVVLALWALATAIMLGSHWMALGNYSRQLLDPSGAGAAGRALLVHARRSYLLAIALKVVAVIALGWLAWRLGVPSVRAQFRPSPPRASR